MECKYSWRSLFTIMLFMGVLTFNAIAQNTLDNVRRLKELWKYDEAVDLLEAAKLNPSEDSLAILNELAECLYLSGRIEDALDSYQSLIEINPENLKNHIQQMKILFQMKEYAVCIEAGDYILKRDSIKSVASLIGDAYVKLNHTDSALAYYYRANKLAPNDSKIINKICDILLNEGKYNELLNIAVPFLNSHPNHPVIGPYQGVSYYLKGNYAESLICFNDLLDAGVDIPSVHYYIGMNHYKLSEYEQALPELEIVYQIDTTNIPLMIHLADTRAKTNADYEKDVKPLYDKAVKLIEPDAQTMFDIYYTHAGDCQLIGKMEQAIDQYKMAYKYDSSRKSGSPAIFRVRLSKDFA